MQKVSTVIIHIEFKKEKPILVNEAVLLFDQNHFLCIRKII